MRRKSLIPAAPVDAPPIFASGNGAIVPLGRTVSDCAALLGVSIPTVNRLLADGRLRGVKLGKRTLITSESISEFWSGLPPAKYRPRSA